MVAPSSSEWRARSAALVVAAVVLTGAVVGTVAAATTTDVGVSTASDSLQPGDETVVEVVVEEVDGGVGAVNATVTFSDPAVAAVENVTLHGEPGLSDVTEREDGVAISAALADTDDSGSVTVATVVVQAENPGETTIDVTVRALGDEDGAAYTIGSVDQPTLSVGDGSDTSDGGDGGDGASGGQPGGSDTDETDAGNSNDGADSRDGSSNDDESSSDEPEDREDDERDSTTAADDADSSNGSGDQSDDAGEQSKESAAADSPRDGTGGVANGWPVPANAVLAAGAAVVVGAAGGFVLYRAA